MGCRFSFDAAKLLSRGVGFGRPHPGRLPLVNSTPTPAFCSAFFIAASHCSGAATGDRRAAPTPLSQGFARYALSNPLSCDSYML
jgi:hypothetical protein